MKIVYCDMCADLLHYGHVRFLKKAKDCGDKLIVGLHSDKTIESYKRTPFLTFEERKEVLSAVKYIDDIIDDAPLNPSEDFLKNLHVDLMVIPSNCDENTINTLYYYPNKNKMLKIVDYTQEISTTQIVKRIMDRK